DVIKSSGQISGTITGIKNLSNLNIVAMNLSEMKAKITNISPEGYFNLEKLTPGKYLIGIPSEIVHGEIYYTQPSVVDLEGSHRANLSLEVVNGNPFMGKIVDRNNHPIQFGVVEYDGQRFWSEPNTGIFYIPFKDNINKLEIKSPGYFSTNTIISKP
ncbi:MAG: hypothetical protein ACPL6F_00225, partial [Anaerolineales bacterium]